MLRVITAAVALATLPALSAQAHRVPDLSGRWELVTASGHAPDDRPAGSLTIREVRATTTATRAPMPPALRALLIEQRMGPGTTTRTIEIGSEGGTTGGSVAGPVGGVRTDAQSQWSTRWIDAHLVMWYFERTATSEHTAEVETTEDWSLSESGELVIATHRRQTGQQSVRTVATYRRQ